MSVGIDGMVKLRVQGGRGERSEIGRLGREGTRIVMKGKKVTSVQGQSRGPPREIANGVIVPRGASTRMRAATTGKGAVGPGLLAESGRMIAGGGMTRMKKMSRTRGGADNARGRDPLRLRVRCLRRVRGAVINRVVGLRDMRWTTSATLCVRRLLNCRHPQSRCRAGKTRSPRGHYPHQQGPRR